MIKRRVGRGDGFPELGRSPGRRDGAQEPSPEGLGPAHWGEGRRRMRWRDWRGRRNHR